MKSAVFERQQGQTSTALETLSTALKKYPKFAKLYMIQGQIYQSQKNYPAARASFATGIKACPKDVTLWILASRLEEADGKSIKARALLDKARLANPASDALWAEAVGVEERSGGTAQAKTVLARGTWISFTLWRYHIPDVPLHFHFLDAAHYRFTGVPHFRDALVYGSLGGAPARSQVSFDRRA